MPDTNKLNIDVALVHSLIAAQFPEWADLTIKPVEFSGWDNRTFHLGEHMSVRLPSAEKYSAKVEIEQRWLPKFAPFLPLQIPTPLAMGKPSAEYPWKWSVYKWLEGETASVDRIDNISQFATKLGDFLATLQQIDTTGGPPAGAHNFYRGGDLATYDSQTRQSIAIMATKIDASIMTKIWNKALDSKWQQAPVWVHGDVAVGNLLVSNRQLSAVIDFGGLGVGDPACDLVMAWTFFQGESRDAFRTAINLDANTWARARGWALWKALIVCAEQPGTNQRENEKSWLVLNEILADCRDLPDKPI